MSDDRHDPLLDACLEEVLGGAAPPNLSGRILREFAVRSSRRSAGPESVSGGPHSNNGAGRHSGNGRFPALDTNAAEGNVAGPRATAGVSATATRRGSWRSSGRNSLGRSARAAIAAGATCLALAGVVVGVIVVQSQSGGPATPVAGPQRRRTRTDADAVPSAAQQDGAGRQQQVRRPPPAGDTRDRVAKRDAPRRPPNDEHHAEMAPQHTFGDPVPFGHESQQRGSNQRTVVAAANEFVRPLPQQLNPSPRGDVVAFIDRTFQSVWAEFGVQPSPPASDAEWCRRTYLRIVGRIPTVEELNEFVATNGADKREQLVDRLVATDEFARNWSFQFTNLLIGRSGGMKPGDVVNREDLQRYLRDAVHAGKPYNELAYELISATGANRASEPDYNPAVNFLIANRGPRATLATARTSQVFLGKKLQCVQCHHHHANGWAQNQFWEMNAFFRQMQVERDKQQRGAARIVNRDFPGESGGGEADVFFEQINGEVRVAYPAFGPEPAPRSGRLAEADLRRELASRIARTEDLARTEVNRLWAHFFGYGFTRPVDDMGPHNAAVHPAVLDHLSREFAAHGYHVKELVSWIALSEPFSLSSKVLPENTADAPEYGERPLFARYYTRQMQPEEVYQSLLVAAGAKPSGEVGPQEQARLAWLGQFTRSMGTDEGDETTSFDGAVNQSLVMMNGPLTRRVISKEDGSMLDRLSASSLSPEEKVEHLFLSAVARKPNARERRLAESLLDMHEEIEALQTVWWALLNSNEFILDH